jgi:hypothetical protein
MLVGRTNRRAFVAGLGQRGGVAGGGAGAAGSDTGHWVL